MEFLKGYKKLYEIKKEKNSELRRENNALREKEEKEISPFSLKVYLEKYFSDFVKTKSVGD